MQDFTGRFRCFKLGLVCKWRVVVLCVSVLFSCGVNCYGSPVSVLVEAESFDNPGGWVVDQQFMDEMGSPFLLAHGLGVPVADATKKVTFEEKGTYKVWVRTRDWVGPWGAKGSPGRFELYVGGRKLETTFGTEGSEWHWQDGGKVDIKELSFSVTLHDLTGFEGRCDAIFFTKDFAFRPPNDDPVMNNWRRLLTGLPREPKDGGQYDLVVVGGGIAGTCASLSAGRRGVKVALIQDRPVLGGNNSSEVRVWLGGETSFEPYPRVGDIVRELEPERRAHYGAENTPELYEDERRIEIVRAEKNISLFLQYRVNEVKMRGDTIREVIAQQTVSGERVRFRGKFFADCTGDGCVGYLADADYEMTLKGHMGRCNLWNIADTGKPVVFERCPWALDLSDKPFPTKERDLGCWFWESGFYYDPFEKGEYIRDLNFRAMYGAWDALKNVRKMYPNHKLNWAAYVSGKRESRLLLGDIILKKEDIVGGVAYPDGCVPATWSIDLHLPHPSYDKGFEGDEFISKAYYTHYTKPYWIPYRCLYSRNIRNLFMAGRDISVTHEALGAVRVMRTCGMMGEVVGMAVSLCKKYNTAGRGVYEKYLEQLKAMMKGEEIAKWLKKAGRNLARDAKIEVSSNYDAIRYPKENINDGRYDIKDNGQRWLSSANEIPDYITFSWDEPRTVSAVRIISGWFDGKQSGDSISRFKLQRGKGSGWEDVEGLRIVSNSRVESVWRFSEFRSERIRLVVTGTPGNISRIWEVEFYH
ncbi:MAG: FAD-dependent oxidoreductase [Planctomycetota bacterium]|nr:MAG: FAD-dependent oxidoreductase [Planctomycetota bacterium]